MIDNSDQPYLETSIDSYESFVPGKPARLHDESASSSSIDMPPISPPAKPPRHFSVYKNEDELNFLRQSTSDQFVQIQTTDSLKNVEIFTVQPTCIAVKTDIPLQTELFDYSISSLPSTIIEPVEIIQLATNLTNRIFDDVKKQLTHKSLPQSIITTVVSSSTTVPSISRPLTLKSSPILDVITTKPTPLFTTSVIVTRPTVPFISATTKPTINNNSDDDSNRISNSNSRLISDHSKLLQTTSKQSSLDSIDPLSYDNTIFLPKNTRHATPTRSLTSDYDNLHGSNGSLNDDNQTTHTITQDPSSTVSSSMTTIYESLDNFPSSSATYVTAASTLNSDDKRTPSQRLNSDITDDDLPESFDFERSSQGRQARRFVLTACF